MTAPAYARGDDRLPMLRAMIDPGPLIDRWCNANTASLGISEIQCQLRDGELRVRMAAVGRDGPIEWGEVPAVLFSDISTTGGGRAAVGPLHDGQPTRHYADISATEAGPAFSAVVDHGFLRVRLQARINLGVLVVVFFNDFNDESGRSSYFHRELFVRAAAGIG